jgi:hypothetical protein
MGLFIVLVLLIGIPVCIYAFKGNKAAKTATESLEADAALIGAKVFKPDFFTTITVSEEGAIRVIDSSAHKTEDFSLKDVSGFEVIVDGQSAVNVGGAVVGGLLFGGIGAIIGSGAKKEKIKSVDFLFKMNDFNRPTIRVSLVHGFGMKADSSEYKQLQEVITELTSTLEYVEKKLKG